MLYQPAEDSFLLQKHIESLPRMGKVLDMGTGTGLLAIASSKKATSVIASDINPEAIKAAGEKAKSLGIKNISFIVSDLFEKIPNIGFDMIMFNPPYLPEEKGIGDISLFSKNKGSGTIVEFIGKVNEFLADDGCILLIISSFTKQKPVFDAISENLLEADEIGKVHRFFEDIILLKIRKSDLQKELSERGITEAKLFAKGKRGVIIKGRYKETDVAVKIKKSTSTAPGTIAIEAKFLRILNNAGIGPRLIMGDEHMLVYSFVEGVFINDFILSNKKRDILTVIGRIFGQLLVMDSLGINKFEMHHPVKHILIKDNLPTLIDFERCRYTENPKNITQFCDFLCGSGKALSEKGIRIDSELIIGLAQEYKQTRDNSKIKMILKSLR